MFVVNHSNGDWDDSESLAAELSKSGFAGSTNKEINSSGDVVENGKVPRLQQLHIHGSDKLAEPSRSLR